MDDKQSKAPLKSLSSYHFCFFLLISFMLVPAFRFLVPYSVGLFDCIAFAVVQTVAASNGVCGALVAAVTFVCGAGAVKTIVVAFHI